VRFLIDADLPRSTKTLLETFGHEAIDVRDIGLRSATDRVIARYAQEHQACLLTGDFGFADIRNYPPEAYYGIVVLGLPRDATASFILHLIEEILRQREVLDRLPNKLAIVEAGRIRLRPT
jgi:predicted nuclease of predicted toxin-antitoxin system